MNIDLEILDSHELPLIKSNIYQSVTMVQNSDGDFCTINGGLSTVACEFEITEYLQIRSEDFDKGQLLNWGIEKIINLVNKAELEGNIKCFIRAKPCALIFSNSLPEIKVFMIVALFSVNEFQYEKNKKI